MKGRVMKSGISVVLAVAFLLLGSCTSHKRNPAIFSSRGGHFPAPSVSKAVTNVDRSIYAKPETQGILLNNSGQGAGIIIDTAPVALPVAPVASYKYTPKKITYKVKKNESLWSIAHAHGISRQELARENSLSANAGLKLNQKLTLPTGARYIAKAKRPSYKSGKSSAGSQIYKVKNGDSLSVIAWRYKTTVAALKSNNKIKSNTIRIGQKLVIPNKHSVRTGRGNSSSTKGFKTTGNLYIVKKGDTLSEIAQNNGSSTEAIMKANGLKKPNIYIGKKLVIPGYKAKKRTNKPSLPQEKIKETLFVKKKDPVVVVTKKPSLPPEFNTDVDTDVDVNVAAPVVNKNLLDVPIVQSDTLEKLAKDFTTTKELILKANPHILSNKDLKAGDIVKVPDNN